MYISKNNIKTENSITKLKIIKICTLQNVIILKIRNNKFNKIKTLYLFVFHYIKIQTIK